MKIEDTYRSECRYGVSQEGMQILTMLMQPLIGCDGTVLYLTLASDTGSIRGIQKIRKLLSLTGLQIDGFERAVAKLEQFELLRTWCRTTGENEAYIFELNRIPTAREFISRPGWITEYLSKMGKEETDAALGRFEGSNLTKNGYEDITRPVAANETQKKEVEFKESAESPAMIRGDGIWPQFSEFIGRTGVLIFPAELRTADNLNLICYLASVNGLNADQMREITGKCVDVIHMTLNTDKMKVLCSKTAVQISETKDLYTLPPAAFLQLKQNGTPATGSDRAILQYLAADMHFPSEVINVMIEHILRISSNRLNRKFVESVAGEWARDRISTREQAIAQTRKSFASKGRSKTHITVETPAYYRKQKENAVTQEQTASPELLAEIQKMQKKMGG